MPVLLAAASLASVLGGSMLFFRKTWTEQSLISMVSVGGGLLLALTILDMLPHSMGSTHQSYMPFVLIGFCFLFVLETLSKQDEQIGVSSMIGITLAFFLHAFMEGISMMASFQVDTQVGLSVVIALILHKIPDGVTLASILYLATEKRMMAFFGAVMLGVMTLLGAWAMTIVERFFAGAGTNVIFAVATGVFLYVSASHMVPYIQRRGNKKASLYFFSAALAYLFVMFFFRGAIHSHV
ncbi:ZIP family metal transporter [Brevibacillus sp. SYSU BS000544]